MFPIVFFWLLYISATYDPNSKFSLWIDSLLNNRVRYTNEGLARYGIQLLGSKMNMVGQYKVAYLGYSRDDLFFIDSGLMYSLLEFGVLYTGFIVLLLSVISRIAAKQNDKALFILCIVVLLYAMVNDVLMKIAYNPLAIIAIPVIFREFEKKKRMRKKNNMGVCKRF